MTRLGDKIRVEPIGEDRYARIEQRVMAELGSGGAEHLLRRWSWQSLRRFWARGLIGLAPALAVAGVLLAVYLNLRATTEPARPLNAGTTPARIVTDERGASVYHLGDAAITVGPRTTIEVTKDPGGAVDIALVTGVVDCEVEPRVGRAPVRVHAGDVHVTVVGTVFRVLRDDRVEVSVSRGKVRVDSSAGVQLVAAGESWSGPATVVAGADELSRNVSGGPAGEAAAQDDSRASGTAADASRDRMDQADSRAAEVAMDVQAPGMEALHERAGQKPVAQRQDSPRKKRSQDRARRSPELGALTRARPARGVPPAHDSELAAIMELETSDPRAAVKRYREQSLRRGSEAEFALYSMAYVQYLELGQEKAALASLNHYQRRFPKGIYTESVLWLRVRILCAGDEPEACRAAAHTYLRRYPTGEHAKLAGTIVNWDM